ncbi:MAG: 23S rRNA (pseudouridine(1915)-N(3))-methyltransferase RlmH [Steroidobacteraceae bacterium]|nr:23S rRNA (pseudouridine(1915)-N(3))-methyltransferase RlmH [Steroidobacteraceae bacterium]
MDAGYEEYARRLGPEIRLELVEIALGKRSGSGGEAAAARADEGRRMLAKVEPRTFVCALDVKGRAHDTESLSRWLAARLADGRDLALFVGGPDGLDPACLARADDRWSLSPLTLPHGLVRVVVAEALYRAASLLKGHPYHRA